MYSDKDFMQPSLFAWGWGVQQFWCFETLPSQHAELKDCHGTTAILIATTL